ncbi:microfibril-associated glycoprotein 4-like [Gastrophryne carolinensis]
MAIKGQLTYLHFTAKCCQTDSYCAPFDCGEVRDSGLTQSGVYLIYPRGRHSNPVPVYCDMTTPGGPWTVIQKRNDGSVDFHRGWRQYKTGFGSADKEHWLGLETIHTITTRKRCGLRVDLISFKGESRFVTYERFAISNLAISAEEDDYSLHVENFREGDPTKTAGDSLDTQNGMKFSTYDHDRDEETFNCAEKYGGGFWFKKCHKSNLNGKFMPGPTEDYGAGIVWATWTGYKNPLKSSQMMIACRP